MPLIQKILPVGIDRIIDSIQVTLFNKLGWDSLPNVIYESNHRAYKTPGKLEEREGLIPEVYDGKKEYREVYFDDNVSASSFFLVDDSRTGDKLYTIIVSIIFQLKLDKIFPTIIHRADEEAHKQVLDVLERTTLVKINSLQTGIANVYSGLLVEQSKLDNMQPFHVFKVDMDINYENC